MGVVERIQELCLQKNIKIRPLEEQLGIANGSIKKWNVSSPSCDRILKVANFFNVSVDWLLTGEQKAFVITASEMELLQLYNDLSDDDKDEIIEIVELKLRRQRRKKTDNESSSPDEISI